MRQNNDEFHTLNVSSYVTGAPSHMPQGTAQITKFEKSSALGFELLLKIIPIQCITLSDNTNLRYVKSGNVHGKPKLKIMADINLNRIL